MAKSYVSEEKTAKIFMSGRSQAVRLPSEFRFEVDEVYIRRDETTGDVVLSARPGSSYRDFMKLRDQCGLVPSCVIDREQCQELRDPLQGWKE